MPVKSVDVPVRPEAKLRPDSKFESDLPRAKRSLSKFGETKKKKRKKWNGAIITVNGQKYIMRIYRPTSMFAKTKVYRYKSGRVVIYGYYAPTKKWFVQAAYIPVKNKRKRKAQDK